MRKPLFITLEGIDGSGKTTTTDGICSQLHRDGINLYKTKEPFNQHIREALNDAPLMTPECETLLFMADRARHIKEFIKPSLEAGRMVVCDRYHDSTIAYQCGGKGMGIESLMQVFSRYCGDLQPDLTLWIDTPVDVATDRLKQRADKLDRMELLSEGFFRKVQEMYLLLHKKEPRRIVQINGDQPQEDVLQDCLGVIYERLSLENFSVVDRPRI